MLRRTLIGFGLATVLVAPGIAQDREAAARERVEQERQALAQAQEKEKQKEKEAAERQAIERAKAQDQEKRERDAGQPINVRVELTIRDQRGTAPPETKTVSLVTSDRRFGRIRTGGNIRTEKFGPQEVRLNVDALPTITPDGRIRLNLTVEYRPADTETHPSTSISETIECLLVAGQPLAVTKSADPNSDRSVTVEVKATILK
jgi:hypothetical protein